ncbi:hypothetical protein HN371_10835 [Candidatus Poribacteria bacterium]|nr:hypothetical protein [Candidatus Poribacteria bacterium]MBT7809391.1 hypothetical protein [Candidatus Poribacteria bacterium]
MTLVNAYWISIASELWYYVYTAISPFSNATFTLAILLVVNTALKRVGPHAALKPSELLVVYIMVTMVSTVAGHTMMSILMHTLAHPFWFANDENQYRELFFRFIPEWFMARDPDVYAGYFQGDSSIVVADHWRAWVAPVFVWSGLILGLFTSTLCFSLLLREHWMQREKLTYPLTQLPLQMTTAPRFWRTRAMWIGFALAAGLRVLNSLHDLFPAVPGFPGGYRLDPHITERPWQAMGYLNMSFDVSVIGLTFFMPLDLGFSLWFFFWLTRVERVVADVVGIQDLHLDQRAAGAWMGIAVLALWFARRHLETFVRGAIRGTRDEGAAAGLPDQKLAILGAVSVGAVLVFCYTAGMSLWAAAAYYVFFLAFSLAFSHVRAALGPPYLEINWINPRQMLTDIVGTRRLGGANVTIVSFFYAFNRANRAPSMPNQAEMLYIGARAGMGTQRLVGAMILAIGAGAVATFWSYLQVGYTYGALAQSRGHYFGWETWSLVQRWLQAPRGPNFEAFPYMIGGFSFVVLLQALRTHLIWWPLHSSGYVLSGASWGGMIYFWFPVMVSWSVKSVLLRIAGFPAYRRAVPFFLGLVLGDQLLRCSTSILSLGLGRYIRP